MVILVALATVQRNVDAWPRWIVVGSATKVSMRGACGLGGGGGGASTFGAGGTPAAAGPESRGSASSAAQAAGSAHRHLRCRANYNPARPSIDVALDRGQRHQYDHRSGRG